MAEQAAPAKKKKFTYRIHITPKNCKGCGICVEFCAPGVLAMDDAGALVNVIAEEKCTGCLLCDNRCPDFAIQVERLDNPEAQPAAAAPPSMEQTS